LKEWFSVNTVLDMQFTGASSSAKATADRRQVEIQIKKIKNDEVVAQKPVAAKSSPVISQKPAASKPHEQFRATTRYNNQKAAPSSIHKKEPRIDISDENQWKTAAMLMRHFPGVVTEIRENK